VVTLSTIQATRCFQAVLCCEVSPTPETREIGVVGGDSDDHESKSRRAKASSLTITTSWALLA